MKKIFPWIAGIFLFGVSEVFACTDNLCETPEIQFQTGEAIVIKQKAQALGSVVNIYEYLRNNAEYVPYHGARSSSLNTFLAMEGNDVDLASTLIAMYRSVGVKSRYAVGNVKLRRADVANWLGVQNESLAVSILQNQGTTIVDNTGQNHVVFEHAWVEVLVNYSNYRGGNTQIQACTQESDQCKWVGLDPSFKLKSYKPQYRNLLRSLQFDYDAYYRAETNQSLRDKGPLEIYEQKALEFLRVNHPGITLEDVLDRGNIVSEELGALPASLPYEVVGQVSRFSTLLDHDQAVATNRWLKKVKIKLNPIIGGRECSSLGADEDFSLVDLSTKKLTVNWGTWDGQSHMAMRLDGVVVLPWDFGGSVTFGCNGSTETMTETSRFNITVITEGSPNQNPIQIKYENLIMGGYYLVATGGETSNFSQIKRAYEKLLAASEQYPTVTNANGVVYVDQNNNGTIETSIDAPLLQHQEAQDELTGGLLYVAQSYYYWRLKEESRTYSRLKNVVSPISDFAGVVSTVYEVEGLDGTPFSVLPGGLLIDLKGIRLNGSWEADKPETYSNDTFKFLGHIGSALEHEVWQELTGYDAISTMRGIQFALRDGAQLLDVHNTTQANLIAVGKSGASDTFPSALAAMGFTNTLPSGFTRKDYTIFNRQLTGWTYSGPPVDGMHVFKGQLASSDPNTNFIERIEANGKTSTDNVFGAYDQAENELLKLLPNLKSRYFNVSGFPTGATVTGATVTSPSGFVMDSFTNQGGGTWRFEVRETSDHGNGSVAITIVVNYGQLVQLSMQFDSSDHFVGGNCNGNSLTGAASQVLAILQSCFESMPSVQFLDRNAGFDPNSYYYKKADDDGLGSQDHLFESIMKIRTGLYSTPTPYWRNYTLPSKITAGPFFAFNVYIEDVYRNNLLVENKNDISGLVSSSYIIENQSWRSPAGGGYVPPQVAPVKPADSTEGVQGAGSTLNVTGATFNNEVFTNKNLISISNNDVVRTPSTVDPVSTVTGNMYHDETDLVIPGKGMPYAFTRTYNSNPTTTSGPGSLNTSSFPISQGWTHSYNMKLVSNDHGKYPNYSTSLAPENGNGKTSSITFIDERGGESNFLLNDASTTSQPTSPRASFDSLALNSPSANQHTVTFTNGVKYIFDSQGQNIRTPQKVARLLRIEDPYGQQLNFGYDTSGKLTTVKDNSNISGRTGLILEYYTSGADLNRLRYVRDWTGRQWEYTYTNGKLSGVKNPSGNAMAYTYVAGTHLLKDIIHPQDRNGVKKTMTFGYYDNNQAYNYVDKLGSEESLIYDLFRRRTRVTNPRGFMTEHYYDQNGALIKLVEPDQGILQFENNLDGLRYLKYDALGNPTRYSYNTDRSLAGALSNTKGQVTREQDAMNKTIDYDYDTTHYNQVKQVKDKNGNTFINAYYTATNTTTGAIKGKLERVTASKVTLNGVIYSNVILSEYKYHADGTPKQITEYIDPAQTSRKRVTDFAYEYLANGGYRLTKTVSGSSKTLKVVEEYDALWRKVSSSVQRRTSATDPTLVTLSTSFKYDSLGRLIETTDPLSNISETTYDANNKVTKQTLRYKLLPSGNSAKHSQCTADAAFPNHHSCIIEQNVYDAADRLTSTTDVNGSITKFQYDAMGNVTKVTNHLGNSLHYEYDAMGRRTHVRDENGYEVRTEYDLAGRIKSITDANNNAIRYEYDALGRKTRVTTPGGKLTTFDQYDGNSNLTKMTDANANAVPSAQPKNTQAASLYNEFDEFNRIVKSLNAKNETTQYTYDLLGNRTRVIDANNQTTVFVYNDLGQLIEVKDPIIEGGTDKVVSITYDEVGNRLTYTDRLGEVTRYSYDRLNRLVKEEYLTDNLSANKTYDQYGDLVSTSYGTSTYTYTYDAAHRMKSKTDARVGKTMHWEYDAVGNLIRKITFEGEIYTYDYNSSNRVVSMSAGEPVYLQASYHYDPAGRLLSRILSNGAATLYNYTADGFLTSVKQVGANGSVIDQRDYEHDHVGNITKQIINGTETIVYGYDPEYRLLSANSSINANDFSYTYDAVGNRKTKVFNGVTHHYIYTPTGNRLDKVRSGSTTGPIVYSFEYDANGSMTGKLNGAGTKLVHLEYDQRRLAKVMGVNNQVSGLSFDYDANAYRIQKQSAAGTKRYLLEGEHLEVVYNGNNQVTATYLRGAVIDEVINGFEKNASGVMENRTFHHDQVNSVVALSDHNGSKVQSIAYGPFGESLGTATGSSQNAMQYTGREKDGETGLYYYRARYYDPEIGRFVSEDPAGVGGGINFYSYVGNNPLILNDPSGNVGESSVVKKVVDEAVHLVLRVKEGWTNTQLNSAIDKTVHLQDNLDILKTSPSYKSNQVAKWDAAGYERPSGSDVDHKIEKILGGTDTLDNYGLLDSSVNRSFGAQIYSQIKNHPYGTAIGSVTLLGLNGEVLANESGRYSCQNPWAPTSTVESYMLAGYTPDEWQEWSIFDSNQLGRLGENLTSGTWASGVGKLFDETINPFGAGSAVVEGVQAYNYFSGQMSSAAGGYVLYPSKRNNNFSSHIYSK